MSNRSIKKDYEKAKVVHKNSGRKVNNLTLSSLPNLSGTLVDSSLPARPGTISDTSQGVTVADINTAQEQQQTDLNNRYDFLLNTDVATLNAQGYFVTTDNGSVFKGTPDSAVAYLPIQDIQNIENIRRTPGALLLHLQQMALAKDTAGHSGGATTTDSGQAPPVDPIPEVQSLPPVVKTDSGTVVFADSGETVPLTPAPASTGPSDTTPTSIIPATSNQASITGAHGKYWWLWYAIAIIIIIVYVKYYRK